MRHEKVVIIRNMFHPSDFEVQTHVCRVITHTQLNDGSNVCVCVCVPLPPTGRPVGAERISRGSAGGV